MAKIKYKKLKLDDRSSFLKIYTFLGFLSFPCKEGQLYWSIISLNICPLDLLVTNKDQILFCLLTIASGRFFALQIYIILRNDFLLVGGVFLVFIRFIWLQQKAKKFWEKCWFETIFTSSVITNRIGMKFFMLQKNKKEWCLSNHSNVDLPWNLKQQVIKSERLIVEFSLARFKKWNVDYEA